MVKARGSRGKASVAGKKADRALSRAWPHGLSAAVFRLQGLLAGRRSPAQASDTWAAQRLPPACSWLAWQAFAALRLVRGLPPSTLGLPPHPAPAQGRGPGPEPGLWRPPEAVSGWRGRPASIQGRRSAAGLSVCRSRRKAESPQGDRLQLLLREGRSGRCCAEAALPWATLPRTYLWLFLPGRAGGSRCYAISTGWLWLTAPALPH